MQRVGTGTHLMGINYKCVQSVVFSYAMQARNSMVWIHNWYKSSWQRMRKLRTLWSEEILRHLGSIILGWDQLSLPLQSTKTLFDPILLQLFPYSSNTPAINYPLIDTSYRLDTEPNAHLNSVSQDAGNKGKGLCFSQNQETYFNLQNSLTIYN